MSRIYNELDQKPEINITEYILKINWFNAYLLRSNIEETAEKTTIILIRIFDFLVYFIVILNSRFRCLEVFKR